MNLSISDICFRSMLVMAFRSSMPVLQKTRSSLKKAALLDLQKVTNGAATKVVY